MTTSSTGKKLGARVEYWRERIAEQERSGMSVHQFCEEQGLTEPSFYFWRKRLRKKQPMRFALVEAGPVRPQFNAEVGLEVVLATGERLRIGAGVDPTVLHSVLQALRA